MIGRDYAQQFRTTRRHAIELWEFTPAQMFFLFGAASLLWISYLIAEVMR